MLPYSGKKLDSHEWVKLSIDEDVIDIVEHLYI